MPTFATVNSQITPGSKRITDDLWERQCNKYYRQYFDAHKLSMCSTECDRGGVRICFSRGTPFGEQYIIFSWQVSLDDFDRIRLVRYYALYYGLYTGVGVVQWNSHVSRNMCYRNSWYMSNSGSSNIRATRRAQENIAELYFQKSAKKSPLFFSFLLSPSFLQVLK